MLQTPYALSLGLNPNVLERRGLEPPVACLPRIALIELRKAQLFEGTSAGVRLSNLGLIKDLGLWVVWEHPG